MPSAQLSSTKTAKKIEITLTEYGIGLNQRQNGAVLSTPLIFFSLKATKQRTQIVLEQDQRLCGYHSVNDHNGGLITSSERTKGGRGNNIDRRGEESRCRNQESMLLRGSYAGIRSAYC